MDHMITTQASPRLTPQQVDDYRREGYLIYDQPVLPPAKFERLRASFDQILANFGTAETPEAMDVPHYMHPELFEWAFDENILDLVEPITGPDIALFSTHFICKPKGNGKRVPWHEDSAYWRNALTPMEVVTVWLALDPSSRENGCMMVIPRSHTSGQQGFSDYLDVPDPSQTVFRNEIVAAHRDDSKRVYIELPPNHCSLHDARVQHGSEPNTSNIRRCGWTLRFTSSAVKFADSGGCGLVYLARGQDRAGNTYGDPTRAHPEVMTKRGCSSRYKNSH
jgi:hypothetical protein